MLEFIRHLVAGGGEEAGMRMAAMRMAAMRMTAMRVTVGTPVTVSWVRQNFAGLMAGTAAVSPSLALD
jgi:hypothetical protein